MNKDWYKSKLFWLAILQLLVSLINFIAGQPPGTSIATVITGILTLIINWIGKPGNPALTPAGRARMNWLERAYAWGWFHVEALWIKVESLRRPFTYMMRDFWKQHPAWAWLIMSAVTGLITWGVIWSLWFLPLYAFHWTLFSHLWWGSPYVPNQQEEPEYTGKKIQ